MKQQNDRVSIIFKGLPVLQRVRELMPMTESEHEAIAELINWLQEVQPETIAEQQSQCLSSRSLDEQVVGGAQSEMTARSRSTSSQQILEELLRTYSLPNRNPGPSRGSTFSRTPMPGEVAWGDALLAVRVMTSARTWREFAATSVRRRCREQQLSDELARIKSWDFDVFRVAEACDRPLAAVGEASIRALGLDKLLANRMEELNFFLDAVEAEYQPNPYHSALHAADVTQAVASVLASEDFSSKLTDLEVLAMLMAAIVHDVGHPGVNNMFLVNTYHDNAITYNDQSVNENVHLAIAFRLLRQEANNFLQDLSEDDFRFVRRTVIDLVLGTDMVRHTAAVKEFSATHALLGSDLDKWQGQSRLLLMKYVLHACDISNPVRPWEHCVEWGRRVVAEFFQQGDQERAQGLTVSPLNDRETANEVMQQQIFCEMFVVPMWESLREIAPLTAAMALGYSRENLQKYQRLLEDGARELPAREAGESDRSKCGEGGS